MTIWRPFGAGGSFRMVMVTPRSAAGGTERTSVLAMDPSMTRHDRRGTTSWLDAPSVPGSAPSAGRWRLTQALACSATTQTGNAGAAPASSPLPASECGGNQQPSSYTWTVTDTGRMASGSTPLSMSSPTRRRRGSATGSTDRDRSMRCSGKRWRAPKLSVSGAKPCGRRGVSRVRLSRDPALPRPTICSAQFASSDSSSKLVTSKR
mmetsp:Transcript_14385/g.48758  ORF Transcript_14385/g.48758 Transcript_14385/m.48758 type:complete len:207 (+) Transcript_14385:390-1010(+)